MAMVVVYLFQFSNPFAELVQIVQKKIVLVSQLKKGFLPRRSISRHLGYFSVVIKKNVGGDEDSSPRKMDAGAFRHHPLHLWGGYYRVCSMLLCHW